MGRLKAVYKLSEIAQALGMTRWAARRWLDEHKIPYHQSRPGTGYRGSGIRVLLHEIKTYAPAIFTSIEESIEMSHNGDDG